MGVKGKRGGWGCLGVLKKTVHKKDWVDGRGGCLILEKKKEGGPVGRH